MLWSEMTEAELILHNCGVWDRQVLSKDGVEEIHYLLRTSHWDNLEPGDQLVSVNGDVKTVCPDYQDPESPNYIDNDERFGCIAWGVIIRRPIPQEE